MDNVTIWHNAKCSKSRATLALLEQRGLEPTVVRYLEEAPTADQLKHVLELLGYEPRALMRTKESLYAELGLAAVDDDEALIRAMVEHPILIERPIVIRGQRAAIGRPPENVLTVMD